MSRGTAYYDLPNGERIELPTTMPDVEEVPGPLCDGKFELPEAVKEMFKWMDETFGTWESDFSSFKIWMKLRKNFNPPVRWEAVQDKRRNPKPLGRNTYLYKARKIKSLARSTHTRASLHKGKQKGTEEQCKHTFKIAQKMKSYMGDGAKLGSLFDGIGGFPLVWETTYGIGTARWASEIEEFPIAVTKKRFPERKEYEN